MSKDRDEFVAVLAREATGKTIREIITAAGILCRLGRAYLRLQEIDCNTGLSDRERATESRVESRIRATAATIGVSAVRFGGDPRGATVKLVLPSGLTNDWCREGWCVPGS